MQQVSQQTIDEKQKGKIFGDPTRIPLFNIKATIYEGDTLFIAVKGIEGKWDYIGTVKMNERIAHQLQTDPDVEAAVSEEKIKEFIKFNNPKQPDLQAQQSVGRMDRLTKKRQVKKQRPQPEPKPIILHDHTTYTKGKIWTVDNDGDIFDIDLGLFSKKEFKSLVKNGVHFYSTKMSAELGRKEIYESWRFNTDDGQSLKLAQDVWVIDKSTKEVFSFELHAGSRKNSKRFIYVSTKKIADSVVNTKNFIDEALKMFPNLNYKMVLNGNNISYLFPKSHTFTS